MPQLDAVTGKALHALGDEYAARIICQTISRVRPVRVCPVPQFAKTSRVPSGVGTTRGVDGGEVELTLAVVGNRAFTAFTSASGIGLSQRYKVRGRWSKPRFAPDVYFGKPSKTFAGNEVSRLSYSWSVLKLWKLENRPAGKLSRRF